MSKCSIIIPIYNTYDYLRESIESILNQTYKNIEVILINDGSTDNSSEICQHFLAQDSRIIFITQENKGLAETRNIGIEKSTGDYIYFFDSDDVLDNRCLELIINKIEKFHVDGLLFSGSSFGVENSFSSDYIRGDNFNSIKSKDYLDHSILKNKFIPSACLYLFKASIIKKTKFPKNQLHEDLQFYIELLFEKSSVVCVSNEKFFNRRVRENSIMTTKKTKANYTGYICAINHSILISKNKPNNQAVGRIIFNLTRNLIKIHQEITDAKNINLRTDLLRIMLAALSIVPQKIKFLAICIVPELIKARK